MMQSDVHGKLTGAGGGGCVIGFPKDVKELYDADGKSQMVVDLEQRGYTVMADIKKSKSGYEVQLNE